MEYSKFIRLESAENVAKKINREIDVWNIQIEVLMALNDIVPTIKEYKKMGLTVNAINKELKGIFGNQETNGREWDNVSLKINQEPYLNRIDIYISQNAPFVLKYGNDFSSYNELSMTLYLGSNPVNLAESVKSWLSTAILNRDGLIKDSSKYMQCIEDYKNIISEIEEFEKNYSYTLQRIIRDK